MMGLISCYSELAIQVTQNSSCSGHKTVTKSIKPSYSSHKTVTKSIKPSHSSHKTVTKSISPSTQTAVTNQYKTTLSTGKLHVITVTWSRTSTAHGLHINSGDDPSTAFRLNTNTRLFRKKRGNKTFQIGDSKFEVFFDLSSANYAAGAEPVDGFYVVVVIDSEVALLIGDSPEFAAFKKLKRLRIEEQIGEQIEGQIENQMTQIDKKIANSVLISRREHFSGDTLYATKAKFSGAGDWHDVVIRCSGDGEKSSGLLVCVDKRVVVRVKRLRLNFRGNQTIFVDGLQVDLMWDVHDWFFGPGSGSGLGFGIGSGFGSGSGSGQGVFMFRTRNGLDSRLWMEDEVKSKDDGKMEFCLLIYGIKS